MTEATKEQCDRNNAPDVSETLLAELVDGIAAMVAQHQAKRDRLPSVDWGTDTARVDEP